MSARSTPQERLEQMVEPLLFWFSQSHRDLPWRREPSPYHVWVSEVMLQQTRVEAVRPYYERFLASLPTVQALAGCPQEQLLKLWEGLGYYSRARNLQRAAQAVVEQYGGELPASYEALRALPGIGDYTAGAVASLAFGLPYAAVDGNVLRVWSRLHADDADISAPATKRRMAAEVQAAQPAQRPGDFNEALMELGALVCLPNGEPLCAQCPWGGICLARKQGRQAMLPVKAPRKARKALCYTVALVVRGGSRPALLLEQRPASGLLAGLWQPLLLEGTLPEEAVRRALAARGVQGLAKGPAAQLPAAKHVFTHLEWHMTGWHFCCGPDAPVPDGCAFAAPEQLQAQYSVPGAFHAYRQYAEKILFASCKTEKNGL